MKLGKRVCFVLARKSPQEAYDCAVSHPAALQYVRSCIVPQPGVPAQLGLF